MLTVLSLGALGASKTKTVTVSIADWLCVVDIAKVV
jgi:hypothetical protein